MTGGFHLSFVPEGEYAISVSNARDVTRADAPAGRVLAHIDTDSSRSLINNRLAYVAISRASDDARIYTNNAETLGERLSASIEKAAAIELQTFNASSNLSRAVHRSTAKPDISRVEIDRPGIAP
jgi:hypothetical protein